MQEKSLGKRPEKCVAARFPPRFLSFQRFPSALVARVVVGFSVAFARAPRRCGARRPSGACKCPLTRARARPLRRAAARPGVLRGVKRPVLACGRGLPAFPGERGPFACKPHPPASCYRGNASRATARSGGASSAQAGGARSPYGSRPWVTACRWAAPLRKGPQRATSCARCRAVCGHASAHATSKAGHGGVVTRARRSYRIGLHNIEALSSTE